MTPAPLEHKQLYDVEVEVDALNAWFVDYCEANLDQRWTIHNAFGSWQIIAGKVGYPFSQERPAFVEIVSTVVIPVLSIRTTPLGNGKALAQFTIFNDSEWLAGISHWSDTSVAVEATTTPKNEPKRYEGTNVVTHTFNRPVSPSRFVAWLRDRCSVHLLSRGQLGDPENKYQTVSILNFVPECKHRGRDYELVWNVAIIQDDVLHEKEAITFYVSEQITEPVTVKVTARCSFSMAMPYFEYLLEECGEAIQRADVPALGLKKGPPSFPKREAYECNKWLISQYFDLGITNYESLVEQWLQIRQEQDLKATPHDPIKSMRTAISEEKKRRNG